MRINLITPFAEKDVVKALGARWDAAKTIWYIVDVADLTPFLRWIPNLGSATEDSTDGATRPTKSTTKASINQFEGPTTGAAIEVPHCGCDVLPWEDGQWIHLETFDDFDNGLSELIDLWSSTSKTATKAVKEAALAHFKEDLEAAVIKWVNNRAKSKKYASIGKELAEFEEVLTGGSSIAPEADSKAPVAPARARKKV